MRLPFAIAAAAVVLGGCQQPGQVFVGDAWVRLAAVPGRPAAAYFTLHGGATDTTLLTVTTPVAIRSELHETMQQGAAMSMRPVGRIALPAGSEVAFAPGGKHVMLFDVNPGIKPGSSLTLRFTFANGLELEYPARAIAAGDAPPRP